LLWFTIGCGAAVEQPGTGMHPAAILYGTEDPDDVAVVVVFAHKPGQLDISKGNPCSGTLVSPRVVATAGHCVSRDWLLSRGLTEPYEIHVFPVLDMTKATMDQALTGVVHVDPQFDPKDFAAGHDTGVFVLDAPLGIKPVPLRKTALTDEDRKKTVRQVGHGLGSGLGIYALRLGVRRYRETTITDVNETQFWFGDLNHNVCFGDSGGPALLDHGVVAITSWSRNICNEGAWATRSDIAAKFVLPFIAQTQT
jgi:hypothetical protein